MKKRNLFIGIIITIVFTGLVILGFKLRKTPSTPGVPTSPSPNTTYSPTIEETIDYLLEISLGAEYGLASKTLVKWTQPEIKIKTHGTLNTFLSDCLNTVINDFNQLSTSTKLILNRSEGDIDLYLAPQEEFLKIEPNYVPGNDGYFWMWWNSKNELYKARILINTNAPPNDQERCHLIREELTQSLGMANDSYKYEDSFFYAVWTATQTYSAIDKEIIKLLYSNKFQPKMTADQIKNLLSI